MSSRKLNAKDLVKKIEKLAQDRMRAADVVSLKDYRGLKVPATTYTLLIIEDDETMRGALKRIFEGEGYRVITAADGTQLNQVMDDSPIDLIVLDIGLPWINGYELAQLMKEHEDLKKIPLVFVSGRTSDLDVKRAFEVGADDFIKKPFEIEQIKKSINTLIRLHYQ